MLIRQQKKETTCCHTISNFLCAQIPKQNNCRKTVTFVVQWKLLSYLLGIQKPNFEKNIFGSNCRKLQCFVPSEAAPGPRPGSAEASAQTNRCQLVAQEAQLPPLSKCVFNDLRKRSIFPQTRSVATLSQSDLSPRHLPPVEQWEVSTSGTAPTPTWFCIFLRHN